MNLHLLRPEWLWALVPAVLFALLLWRSSRRQGQWSSVIDPELLPHLLQGEWQGTRGPGLAPFLLLLWVIACLAAAGPSLRKIPQPVHTTEDALVLVLDLSYSMNAGDLSPSRIDRARQKLRDLLAQRKEGQTALIAYAGDSHVVTPLTDDTPTIANLLPALQPGIMPLPGSQPAQALQQALELLRSAGLRQGRILLLTDGIDDSDRNKIVEVMRGSGVDLSIMGIGTRTGAPLPLPAGGFLKDEKGAIVTPRLEEDELRRTAEETGGRYRRMQLDDSDLQALLAESPLQRPAELQALGRNTDTWEDQGYILVLCLLPAVLLLFRRGWLVCLVPLLLMQSPPEAQANSWDDLWLTRDQQAQRALQAKDFERAGQLFKDRRWAGTAAYRDENYEAAAQAFSSDESADDLYNRGNALARQGKLPEALEAYEKSLQLQPGKEDAEANHQLVEDLLKQQQQQQQDQQQSGDQQDQDQQSGGQQNQSDEGQGSQQNQQGQQPDSQGQSGDQQADQQDAADPSSGQEQQQNPPGQDKQSGEQSGEQSADNQDTGQADELFAEEAQPENAGRADGAAEPADGDSEDEAGKATGGAEAEDQERDQALEQWLRRVPDDPAGLLREKFRYESRQRQQHGNTSNDEKYW
ncbi:VWA domain-containing protein [Haliea sp. E17]|uniref:VWA domain-containing protein n=1 Tax=Haliea sp. E17 TaxID=3401576 RepID=UPI003AAE6AF3